MCTPGPKAQLGAHPRSPEPSLTESLPGVSTMWGSDTALLASAPFSGSPSPVACGSCAAPSQGTPEGEFYKGKSVLQKRLLCPICRVGDKSSCPSPLVLGHPRMWRQAHGRATPSILLWARAGGFQEGWKEGWLAIAPCPGKSTTVPSFPWSLQQSWNQHQFSDTLGGMRLQRGEGVGRGNTALKSEIRHLPLLSAVEGGPGRRGCVSPCTPAVLPGGQLSGSRFDTLSGSPPWPGLDSHI